jgi:glucose-6-phosphate isomerase
MTTRKMELNLGPYQVIADEVRKDLMDGRVRERIWRRDHTVWKSDPREISDRLGWLASPQEMLPCLPELKGVVDDIRADGYRFALLLGMGGSSLAPEVFQRIFGRGEGYLDLAILDSTDPGAVLAWADRLDLNRTLFIVSTKSGGTVETFSFFKYFYNLVVEKLGVERAGRHFVAITDPGSALADLARIHRFRHTFLNNPEIGGRYSVLSFFGLFPASLIGMDPAALLEHAAAERDHEFSDDRDTEERGGVFLGALLGELARHGRDKLTFFFSPQLTAFGDWLEQLIAESTGKEGHGILPVVGEPLVTSAVYGNDRVFVSLRLTDDMTGENQLEALAAAGHPVINLRIEDLYDLGGQCFFWEVAIAAVGWRLGINPFDQPDVESAKIIARKMIAEYMDKGVMPMETPVPKAHGISIYGVEAAGEPGVALDTFLRQAEPGAYVAIQAYLRPCHQTDEALSSLRTKLLNATHLPVTVGYGPRFLHSTGQLHKGDAGHGLFIQLTADDPQDAPIPDQAGRSTSGLSFGILKAAQAFGDRQALVNAGRRVIRFHLNGDVSGGIEVLVQSLKGEYSIGK